MKATYEAGVGASSAAGPAKTTNKKRPESNIGVKDKVASGNAMIL